MVEIVDGTGSGKRAKVNADDNSLLVTSINLTEEHFITKTQQGGYIVSVSLGGSNTLEFLTTEAGPVLLLQTLNSLQAVTIEGIGVSADAAGGIIRVIKNPIIGTLTNNTPIAAGNLNFSSTKTAIGNFQVWDGVGTSGISGLTGGTVLTTHHINSGLTSLPINGAINLEQNDIIVIEFNNVTGGTINFEATIRFYFE